MDQVNEPTGILTVMNVESNSDPRINSLVYIDKGQVMFVGDCPVISLTGSSLPSGIVESGVLVRG